LLIINSFLRKYDSNRSLELLGNIKTIFAQPHGFAAALFGKNALNLHKIVVFVSGQSRLGFSLWPEPVL
jgi:hypothetical protein